MRTQTSSLMKLPPYKAAYKVVNSAGASPTGVTNPSPDLVLSPVPPSPPYVLNPNFFSNPHWFGDLAWRRAFAFEAADHTGKLLRLNRDIPIVGNLRASLELLGLRGKKPGGISIGDDFASLPRGARKHTTPSGMFTVWESPYYFGRSGTLLKAPKVVLISAEKARLPVDLVTPAVSLEDRIDTIYETLITRHKLTVILDKTNTAAYNPYTYGIPLTTHNAPYSTAAALTAYIGGELLVIHINPWDFEFGITGDYPFYDSFNPTNTAYYCYFPGLKYIYSIPFHDYTINEDEDYIVFQDPAADVAVWNAAAANYTRRRHIIHNAQYATDYDSWLRLFDNRVPSSPVSTMGTAPHGFGNNYMLDTKPAGMVLGRRYTRLDGMSQPINTDIAACIIEDITAFYGS